MTAYFHVSDATTNQIYVTIARHAIEDNVVQALQCYFIYWMYIPEGACQYFMRY